MRSPCRSPRAGCRGLRGTSRSLAVGSCPRGAGRRRAAGGAHGGAPTAAQLCLGVLWTRSTLCWLESAPAPPGASWGKEARGVCAGPVQWEQPVFVKRSCQGSRNSCLQLCAVRQGARASRGGGAAVAALWTSLSPGPPGSQGVPRSLPDPVPPAGRADGGEHGDAGTARCELLTADCSSRTLSAACVVEAPGPGGDHLQCPSQRELWWGLFRTFFFPWVV